MSDRESLRDTLKRYLDLGTSLSGTRLEDLEDLLRDLVRGDNSQRRERAEDFVEEVRARSRRSADHLGAFIRAEIRKELEARAQKRWSELGELLERGLDLLGEVIGSQSHREAQEKTDTARGTQGVLTTSTGEVEAPAKKVPAKRAPSKAGPAKKAPAKKAPAKKAAAKKAAPATRRPEEGPSEPDEAS